MALVIEDGTGVDGANSYVTVAEIIAYAAERGVTITEEQAEVPAIKAMDFFWTLCLRGEIAYPGQQWTLYPRIGLFPNDHVEGAVLLIPEGIKLAQKQLALDSFSGIDLTPSREAEPALKRRKTGPIEREYFEGSPWTPNLPMANAYLAPFKCGHGEFRVRTYRA